MISLSALINVVVWLIIIGLIFGLLSWLINETNPPQPWNKVARVVLAVAAVVTIIGLLLSLVTGTPLLRP